MNAQKKREFEIIEISRIEEDEKNPRKVISLLNKDGTKFTSEELADSVKEHGILQPITVRRGETKDFKIISGHRRFAAAQLAGLKEIPAIIFNESENLGEDQVTILQIVENVQREDMSDLDIGNAIVVLTREHGKTQREIAKLLGKSDSTISRLVSAASEEFKPYLSICGGDASVLEKFRKLDEDTKAICLEIYKSEPDRTLNQKDIKNIENYTKIKREPIRNLDMLNNALSTSVNLDTASEKDRPILIPENKSLIGQQPDYEYDNLQLANANTDGFVTIPERRLTIDEAHKLLEKLGATASGSHFQLASDIKAAIDRLF